MNLAGYVVDDNGNLSTTVVHRRKAVVAFLTRRVPDLKLHCRIVHHNGLRQERGYTRRKQYDLSP